MRGILLFATVEVAGAGLARCAADRREALDTADEKAGVPKPD